MNKYDKKLVGMIIRNGNGPGIPTRLFQQAKFWATESQGPDAEALQAFLNSWVGRPFLTAEELAPIWPALMRFSGLARTPQPAPGPATLENFLLSERLPFIQNIDGSNVFQHPWSFKIRRFFIVERVHYWRGQIMHQDKFNRIFRGVDKS